MPLRAPVGAQSVWSQIQNKEVQVYHSKYFAGTQFHSFTTSVVHPILIAVPAKKGTQPLSVTHPELAKEADGWDPVSFTAGSARKVTWKCERKHHWEARIYSRANGRGCPFCSNQKVLIGFNDLSTTEPGLALEADGWDPRTVTSGSNKKYQWKCPEGHRWETELHHRTGKKKLSCPICSGQKVLAGFNDLATTHPLIAIEAYGWDPTTVTFGSEKKYAWKCAQGHTWATPVLNRTSKGSGCLICGGKVILKGFNDLESTHPSIAKEAFGWDPTTVGFGSNRKRTWQCSKEHTWVISPNARTDNRRPGCPICTGRKVLKGFNDIGTTQPLIAREAFRWDPGTATSGSSKKQQWKCDLNHIWSASISSRTRGRGCPTCAHAGFNQNSEGWVYFLGHPKWQMLQIGITNFPDKRLKNHKQLGWDLIEIRGPMDGLIVREWETAILRMLKAKGADLSNSKIAGKFDGYSEAWSKSTFEVSSIKELMRLTEEYEDGLKSAN